MEPILPTRLRRESILLTRLFRGLVVQLRCLLLRPIPRRLVLNPTLRRLLLRPMAEPGRRCQDASQRVSTHGGSVRSWDAPTS